MKTAYVSELSKLVDIDYVSEVDEVWYNTAPRRFKWVAVI